ncbi:MAG: hypothetical protein PQJ59_12550 [Spirochaetales bacterium]|nr:hypothetical protein [Spirochaetales bacterium]
MKHTVLFLIIAMTGVSLFANGAQEANTEPVNFSVEELSYEPLHTITVEPTKEILAVFESLGIESSYLLEVTHVEQDNDDGENIYTTPAPVTQEVNRELALILSENRGNVVDMINAELSSRLHRDFCESAQMTIGSYQFNASLGYPEV